MANEMHLVAENVKIGGEKKASGIWTLLEESEYNCLTMRINNNVVPGMWVNIID